MPRTYLLRETPPPPPLLLLSLPPPLPDCAILPYLAPTTSGDWQNFAPRLQLPTAALLPPTSSSEKRAQRSVFTARACVWDTIRRRVRVLQHAAECSNPSSCLRPRAPAVLAGDAPLHQCAARSAVLDRRSLLQLLTPRKIFIELECFVADEMCRQPDA